MMQVIESIQDIRRLVRAERERRDMTQSDLASLLGFSAKWIGTLETGEGSPPFTMVLDVLHLLGMQMEISAPSLDDTPEDPEPSDFGMGF